MADAVGHARFYKCDLQMQTPFSPSWREDTSRTRFADGNENCKAAARAYLEACHLCGLEVVGITDHNFAPSPDASFIHFLRQENASIATQANRAPLVILPGFEIEADVGRGIHVICLFPPDIPLDIVDSRLTTLGLPPDRRFS